MSYYSKSSTKPQSAKKLTTELQKCEELQDTMKAANFHWRKTGTCMGAPGITEAHAVKLDEKIRNASPTGITSWNPSAFEQRI